MALSKGIKSKIGKLTYDKAKLNQKILQAQKSMDEVKKIVNGK